MFEISRFFRTEMFPITFVVVLLQKSPLLSSILFCIFSVTNVWCVSSSPLSVLASPLFPLPPSPLPLPPWGRFCHGFFLVRQSFSWHRCLYRGQALGFCKVPGANLDCNISYINKVELKWIKIELNWMEKLVWTGSTRNTEKVDCHQAAANPDWQKMLLRCLPDMRNDLYLSFFFHPDDLCRTFMIQCSSFSLLSDETLC